MLCCQPGLQKPVMQAKLDDPLCIDSSARKETMMTRESAESRWPRGLLGIVLLLALATAAGAQGTLEYRFSGQVNSLNLGSSVFPGVIVGSPVEEWFTMDYNTPDTDPNPNYGSGHQKGVSS